MAAVYDTYASKAYLLPPSVAEKALNDALSTEDENRINQLLIADLVSCQSDEAHPTSLNSLRLLVTNRCNFECSYCFADHGSYGLPRMDMTAETATSALDYFYSRYGTIRQISFFGGEPLLAVSTIKAVCEHIDDLGLSEKPSYSMVTNASLLNDEIAALIADHNISVVASIDGPKRINDLQRVQLGGCGTFDLVDWNLRRYRDKLHLSIEATYTSNHTHQGLSRRDTHEYLSERYETTRVLVNDAVIYDSSEVTALEPLHANPTWEVFDFFASGCSSYTDYVCDLVHIFASTKRAFRGFCSAGYNKFTVDMMGNIFPCHLFVGDKRHVLGNVISKPGLPPSSFKSGAKNTEECASCPYLPFCSGCTFNILNGRSTCAFVKEGVSYFLHQMLDLLLTDQDRYNDVLRGCAEYERAHVIG